MSLIKLASTPILVINKESDNTKTLSPRNFAAAAVGGTTGFLAGDHIEHGGGIKNFNKDQMLHRYGKRIGQVMGGLVGAAGVYSLMKREKQDGPSMYMV